MDLEKLKTAAQEAIDNDPDGFGEFIDYLAELGPQKVIEILAHADLGAQLHARGIKALPPADDISEYVLFAVRKGSMTPNAQQSLQAAVRLVSEGTPFVIAAGDQGQLLCNIAVLVTEKFQSGNEIPVERITLTRAEVGL